MSASTPFIGIDFGTSNSSIAWFNPQTRQAEIIHNAAGKEKTPTLVYFGEQETLVGDSVEQLFADSAHDAQQREAISGLVVKSIKRYVGESMRISLLGGKDVRPVEVVAEILRKLKREAEERQFRCAVTRAVITYPAAFGLRQRGGIKKAAEMAGFTEVELLEEPVAAALAFLGMGWDVGSGVLVYDLGGGTFDAAFLVREADSFRVAVAPVGDLRCGGDDFDQALYDYWDEEVQHKLGRSISLVEEENDAHFLRECRKRKEFLSEGRECNFVWPLPGGEPYRFTITRNAFDALIEDEVRKTVDKTREMAERARREGFVVESVLLIGGSSELALVRQMLSETLPVSPQKWQHRDIAVALGAAYHAQRLWGEPLMSAQPLETYRLAVETAWADGILTEAEAAKLKQLAAQLGLRPEEVTAIDREIQEQTLTAILAEGQSANPMSASSSPATFTVALDGHGDFTTISAAILKAEPGTRIIVRDGVYNESLVIDKPLEIIGDDQATNIFIQSTDANCILMQTESATVRGLKLKNQSTEQGPAYFAVDIPRGRLLLDKCEIESGSAACVAIHGLAAAPIIRHCLIHDAKTAGIYVYGGGGGTIEDCDIFSNNGEGVVVKSGGNPIIRRCKIRNGKDAAIVVDDGGLGTVEHCDIYDNASGIGIGSNSNPVVRRCQIHHGGLAGLLVTEGGQGTVEDCEIYANEKFEVITNKGGNPHLLRCKIYESKGGGVGAIEQGRGVIEECDIFRNVGAGVIINASDMVVRACKIWGGQDAGVYVTNNGTGRVADCDIFGHTVGEVVVDKGANPVIAHCRIHDGKVSGVSVVDNGQGLFEDCDIFGHPNVNIGIAGGNPVIRRCKIHDGKNAGVFVRTSGKGTVEDCQIFGNDYAGVEIREAGAPTILRCQINRNRLGVYVYAKGGGRVEACDLRANRFGALEIAAGCDVSLDANTVGQPASRQPLKEAEIKSLLNRFKPQQDLYIAPSIPSNMLQNAKSVCHVPDSESLVGLIDCTLWGGAKDCVLFGLESVYFRRSAFSEPGKFAYTEFPMLTFEKDGNAISFSNGQSIALGRSALTVDKAISILESLKQLCESKAAAGAS